MVNKSIAPNYLYAYFCTKLDLGLGFASDYQMSMWLEDAYDAVFACMDFCLKHFLLLPVHVDYRKEQFAIGILQQEEL